MAGIMYNMKPLYQFDSIDLPNTMYKLPQLQGKVLDKCGEPEEPEDLSQLSPELLALRERQLNLLARLDQALDDVNKPKRRVPKRSENHEQLVKAVVQSTARAKPVPVTNQLDIVIHADPEDPPYSLKVIRMCLDKKFKVLWKVHHHSSLPSNNNKKEVLLWPDESTTTRHTYDIIITLIWKKTSSPTLHLSPTMTIPVQGEANIARFFGRLLGLYDNDPSNVITSATIDAYISAADVISGPSNLDKSAALESVAGALKGNKWVLGKVPSIADFLLVSALFKFGEDSMKSSHQGLLKWFQSVESLIS